MSVGGSRAGRRDSGLGPHPASATTGDITPAGIKPVEAELLESKPLESKAAGTAEVGASPAASSQRFNPRTAKSESGDTESGDTESGDTESGDTAIGDTAIGETKSGEAESGDDVEIERALLDQAVGGWRGLIDSGAPALIFVTSYVVTGQQMRPSLIAAIIAGLLIMVWRLLRRESLQQVVSGFIGVAISAWVASRTGRPQDFFLLGILTNLGYGLAMLVSLLVGWPAIGLLIGSLQGDPVGWRKVPRLRAAYRLCTWIWVGVFFGRLLFTVPLYLAGAVGPLGVAKVLLGWPPFLLAVYLCYRVLHPVLAAERAARNAQIAESADVSAEAEPDVMAGARAKSLTQGPGGRNEEVQAQDTPAQDTSAQDTSAQDTADANTAAKHTGNAHS